MMDDDVGHVVPIRVPLLVQAVNGAEDELVQRDGSIVVTHGLQSRTAITSGKQSR